MSYHYDPQPDHYCDACQSPDTVCGVEGLPGILIAGSLLHANGVTELAIERCDECRRYANDYDAAQALLWAGGITLRQFTLWARDYCAHSDRAFQPGSR